MARFRKNLPLLGSELFTCYVGLDTELLYREQIELPGFASYPLLKNEEHKELIRDYYRNLVDLAHSHGIGLILDTVTWIANKDRGAELGITGDELKKLNIEAVNLISEVRDEKGHHPTILCGQVGPRGDGYAPAEQMTTEEAEEYHSEQIEIYSHTEVDFVSGFTLCYPEEASGIVRAAKRHDIPVAISFTVETDGRLPTGVTLCDAIAQVDSESDNAAMYFLINCAHPDHFEKILKAEPWVKRLRGVVANASRCSHAELDVAETLDEGDPYELGVQLGGLRKVFPHFNILGGCCGTNLQHMDRIIREALAV